MILWTTIITDFGDALICLSKERGTLVRCSLYGKTQNEFYNEYCRMEKDFSSNNLFEIRKMNDSLRKIQSAIDGEDKRIKLEFFSGTEFQHSVWDAILNIPKGKTATYSDIAAKIGKPKSARAVANACGANPIAVIVPCHRVVPANGGVGGYRWGRDRKAELLRREGIII